MINSSIIKVVIADDNLKIRMAVRKFLQKAPNIRVIGEAQNGQEALDLIEELAPDILILDINMPVMDGLMTLKILCRRGYKVAVIILSGMDDGAVVEESLKWGAHSFILKDDEPSSLMNAVNKAFRGEKGCISQRVAQYP